MAGIQTVGWPGLPPHHYYDLRAEPTSWCQRHIPWLPFIKDTRPKFNLTITCVREDVPIQKIRWFISFENGIQTGHEIEVPYMRKGQKKKFIIGDRLLGFGGDTILAVNLPNGGEFHTLVSFWTLRGETVLYGLILSILSALVGALFVVAIN